MARRERLICPSSALTDSGPGVRFQVGRSDGEVAAFAIRYAGIACAFVNRCPHAGTELDWQPGEFFEESGLYLICSTHGALFEPINGNCVAGPCRGASLQPIDIGERDGGVFLLGGASEDEEQSAP